MAVSRPLLIGISGGSGSGKSHLASAVLKAVGSKAVAVLEMDQYFKSDAVEHPQLVNFDHPSHLDLRLLIRHLKALREGRAIWVPSYDFGTMCQTPRSKRLRPGPVILVEGLFILAEPIASLMDLTCFLDVAPDVRLLGRILRDIDERGATAHEVIDRYQRFVRPSYQIFVGPTMQNADVVVDFTYRRAFFTQLLIDLVRSYVERPFQISEFARALRNESAALGYQPEDGFMPFTADIFRLAHTYPAVEPPMTTKRSQKHDRYA